MLPRAIRRPTPLTATKPANSFVRSSVSRMVSLPIRLNAPYPCTIYVGGGSIVQYRDGEICGEAARGQAAERGVFPALALGISPAGWCWPRLARYRPPHHSR